MGQLPVDHGKQRRRSPDHPRVVRRDDDRGTGRGGGREFVDDALHRDLVLMIRGFVGDQQAR